MKKFLLPVFLIIPLSAFATAEPNKFYIGLHGNQSWSVTRDGDYIRGGNMERLDNGDDKSNPNFSMTAGLETKNKLIKGVDGLLAGEFFFDNINKTTIQNDKPYINSLGGVRPRPMANRPIYKTNYLAGLRGKFGLSLLGLIDLYGHAGLLYWKRTLYVKRSDDPYYDLLWFKGEEANWKIMPFTGIGATISVTERWAINASYMKVVPSLVATAYYIPGNYEYTHGRFNMGIDVLTIGVLYYF